MRWCHHLCCILRQRLHSVSQLRDVPFLSCQYLPSCNQHYYAMAIQTKMAHHYSGIHCLFGCLPSAIRTTIRTNLWYVGITHGIFCTEISGMEYQPNKNDYSQSSHGFHTIGQLAHTYSLIHHCIWILFLAIKN